MLHTDQLRNQADERRNWLSFAVTPERDKILRKIAERQGKTLAEVVDEALDNWIARMLVEGR